ncbi:MAG: hypothetical protein Kow0069_13900 [Promethearchaeota archaeon]
MTIDYDEFSRLELRVGRILEAKEVEASRSLTKLLVDVGEDRPRQIVAGLKGTYEAKKLVGRKIVVLTNLAPKKLMGLESKGMLLAADVGGKPFLLGVDEQNGEVPPGSVVR